MKLFENLINYKTLSNNHETVDEVSEDNHITDMEVIVEEINDRLVQEEIKQKQEEIFQLNNNLKKAERKISITMNPLILLWPLFITCSVLGFLTFIAGTSSILLPIAAVLFMFVVPLNIFAIKASRLKEMTNNELRENYKQINKLRKKMIEKELGINIDQLNFSTRLDTWQWFRAYPKDSYSYVKQSYIAKIVKDENGFEKAVGQKFPKN